MRGCASSDRDQPDRQSAGVQRLADSWRQRNADCREHAESDRESDCCTDSQPDRQSAHAHAHAHAYRRTDPGPDSAAHSQPDTNSHVDTDPDPDSPARRKCAHTAWGMPGHDQSVDWRL